MIRNINALLILFLATSMLAGCGGSSGGTETGGSAGDASTTVAQDGAASDPALAAADQNTWLAATDPAPANDRITTVEIAKGLENPWAIGRLPDGTLLVTERPGRLRPVSATGAIGAPIAGLPPVAFVGQGGLLDVLVSPNFATDSWLYFTYSEPAGGDLARTAVARARYRAARLEDWQVIYRQQPAVAGGDHFGARLAMAGDGSLYVTLGDRTRRDLAQDLASGLGKVVRIAPDGGIPADNPFIGQTGVEPAVYAWGVRNPQSAARHPGTGDIWIGEHGPLGGDEINRLRAGTNYGWPCITYGREYADGAAIGEGTEAADVAPPLHYWVPVSVAPAGMIFYNANQVPALRGTLLVGALAARALIRLTVTDDAVTGEERLLQALGERIRDIEQGADGHPYLITDSGRLLRIDPR
ncbi:MAG: PQQ-dependent sugar dehydrogenase [Burkholderiaceae bacterium]